MKKIANHNEIDVFAPDHSRFSFLKSPYAAHKTFSAVDIYYANFGGFALSPVNGEIIDIKKFDSPTPFKNRASPEYVIALHQGNYVIKILHVKPEVSIGETVSTGDRIGTFIRNGYFIFWNDSSMHVEIRHAGDYLRASNNLRLKPNIDWNELSDNKSIELECCVEEINDRYALLSSPYETCGDVKGFSMDGGFLDGFVSTVSGESFFGIVRSEGYFHPAVSELKVMKKNSVINCAGIAACLSFNEPKIKVIPSKFGRRPFSTGDTVHIKVEVR